MASSAASVAAAPAPETRITFDLSADAIRETTARLIAAHRATIDRVAALPAGERTFDTLLRPLALAEAELTTLTPSVEFGQHVFVEAERRDASSEADKALAAHYIEMGMRVDLFEALVAFNAEHGAALTGEWARYLERLLRDMGRNGLAQPADKREQIGALKKEIADKQIEFSRNIAEDKSRVLLSSEELDGLPQGFIDALATDPESGKKIVTMQYPDVLPCLKKAHSPDVRARLERCFSSRCQAENTPILEHVLALRHQQATLLGFPTHSHFKTAVLMSKTPEAVRSFLAALKPRLDVLAARELEELRALKRANPREADDVIRASDFNYYHTMLMETRYQVDDEVIKPYFPLEKALSEVLSIYAEMLSLRFERIERGHTWHEEVIMYRAFERDGDALVGVFYLDLFPRESKFSHAACFPMVPSCKLADGSFQHPSAALVCNFSRPTANAPALLRHSEVVTLMHEMGHLFHNLCSTTALSRFRGTSVERDFVEAPSQFLENWCWQPAMLKRISSHYETGASLPDELIARIIAAKNVNNGLLLLRQVFFATFDITIHSQPTSNTEALYGSMRSEITNIAHTEGTNPAASFGHLLGGYDSGYYGYLWSEVFAADMFAHFKQHGLTDAATGRRYRDVILARGGSVDGADLLREFLGREPNQEAFLKDLGLD